MSLWVFRDHKLGSANSHWFEVSDSVLLQKNTDPNVHIME